MWTILLLVSCHSIRLSSQLHPNERYYDGLVSRASDKHVGDDEGGVEPLLLDIAISLKRGYTDDLVADLFAASHGIEKVARVIELVLTSQSIKARLVISYFAYFYFCSCVKMFEHDDETGCWFHFKMPADMLLVSSSSSSSEGQRQKRHIHHKLSAIRQDDRVHHVLVQSHLKRFKRSLLPPAEVRSKKRRENIMSAIQTQLERWLLEEAVERRLGELKRLVAIDAHKRDRKRVEEAVDENVAFVDDKQQQQQRQGDEENQQIQNVTTDASTGAWPDFNDAKFHDQWYLLDDEQFVGVSLMNDLNVRSAWASGFSGAGVNIIVVDDGLDHEHPDFAGLGKYVCAI